MTKNKRIYIPSKWIYIVVFAFAALLTIVNTKKLDNDLWYLLSEGREIVKNGIYHIDPLSIHKGLEITVQNWASASLLWIIYSTLGELGILSFMIICNFLIMFFLYKICDLISDQNKVLSLIITFCTDLFLNLFYIVSRPQIISFVILLALIYVLELYVKTENKKYLIWLPIISILEVNLHASLWWMIFLFSLPYIIDSFKSPILNTQGYKVKPLLIYLGIAFLCGLLNPYFYKAITFIFTSYTDKYMHLYINELQPFAFANILCKIEFVLVFIITLIYAYFRKGNIRVRYLCLFAGTLILSFMAVKSFSHFILVSTFPLAYFFKDIFPNDFSELGSFKKFFDILLGTVSVVIIGFGIFSFVKANDKIKLTHDADEAMKVLKDTWQPSQVTLYSSFNNGGYVEFKGYKPYIDPRAEVFLKINNKKADIFKENYLVQNGKKDINKFLKKYNFTHLLVQKTDYLYNNMNSQDNYVIIYENSKKGYRLYARKDLFTLDQLNSMNKDYSSIVENAKKEAAKN